MILAYHSYFWVGIDITPQRSPWGQRIKSYISMSIHGSAPGYCPHFRKPETLLDGEDDREHGSHGSATVSRTLYSHATGLWSISLISSFTGIAPRVASKAT